MITGTLKNDKLLALLILIGYVGIFIDPIKSYITYTLPDQVLPECTSNEQCRLVYNECNCASAPNRIDDAKAKKRLPVYNRSCKVNKCEKCDAVPVCKENKCNLGWSCTSINLSEEISSKIHQYTEFLLNNNGDYLIFTKQYPSDNNERTTREGILNNNKKEEFENLFENMEPLFEKNYCQYPNHPISNSVRISEKPEIKNHPAYFDRDIYGDTDKDLFMFLCKENENLPEVVDLIENIHYLSK